MLYIRGIDCERIVDGKTCLCGHVSKGGGDGEIKFKKKKEWKCTHGRQLGTAHILEANDVLVACFFSSFIIFPPF